MEVFLCIFSCIFAFRGANHSSKWGTRFQDSQIHKIIAKILRNSLRIARDFRDCRRFWKRVSENCKDCWRFRMIFGKGVRDSWSHLPLAAAGAWIWLQNLTLWVLYRGGHYWRGGNTFIWSLKTAMNLQKIFSFSFRLIRKHDGGGITKKYPCMRDY